MPTSGEAIRLMNYVDDITTTLRRIEATAINLSDDERKKVADYMRKAEQSYTEVVQRVEKGR